MPQASSIFFSVSDAGAGAQSFFFLPYRSQQSSAPTRQLDVPHAMSWAGFASPEGELAGAAVVDAAGRAEGGEGALTRAELDAAPVGAGDSLHPSTSSAVVSENTMFRKAMMV